MDNPEKLATLGTQDEEKQNKKTQHIWLSALIGYTRRRKTKQENTMHLTFCANRGTQDGKKKKIRQHNMSDFLH